MSYKHRKNCKKRHQVLKSGQYRTRVSSNVCVRKGDDIRKVKRDKAEEMVRAGWSYCPRSAWKGTKNVEKGVENTETKSENKINTSKKKKERNKN